jgi:cupin 2 domain-containing protein
MNILNELPSRLAEEEIVPLLSSANVRIERIVSTGHSSPPGFWYDQEEHEWVLVLRGRGVVEFDDGRQVALEPGDHLHIPPRVRHRVRETSREEPTLWLAVFWSEHQPELFKIGR